MIVNEFPENMFIDNANKHILFGGDRLRGVFAYSVFKDEALDIPIGVASLSTKGDFNKPEIVGVYVNPNYRGKGIAKELIKEIHSFYESSFALNKQSPLVIQLISKESALLKDFCVNLGLDVHCYI